ncbi:MAG: hypothetical protein J6B10_02520 [Lachnospiraceae bacterium]|nr:hypothetical protein [Lachnospiraceae bacterium]
MASLILFIFWMQFMLSKRQRDSSTQELSFWEKEAKANSTRRKPLDTLDYIIIPTKELPMYILEENEEIQSILSTMEALTQKKIVNLTGISNTDLKLQYGAPNLPLLMEYDQNYTLLARTLQKWASVLYEAQYTKEAQTVLEFAMTTKTDVTASYILLARIYQKTGYPSRIDELKTLAATLRSASKTLILKKLEEIS